MTRRVFRLNLVRHGETTHNGMKLLQGQLETQLTTLGREQATLLGRYLEKHGIVYDQVHTSDLSRAYESCQLICNDKYETINRNKLLRERSHGKSEGMPLDKVRDLLVQANVYSSPSAMRSFRHEGGESRDDVSERVQAFLRDLFPTVKDGQQILVVSHAATIREFMTLFAPYTRNELKIEHLLVTPNTGINNFDILLNANNEIERVKPIHMHELPHLTYDVYNTDNPHPTLPNAKTLTVFDRVPSSSSDPAAHCSKQEDELVAGQSSAADTPGSIQQSVSDKQPASQPKDQSQGSEPQSQQDK